MLRVRIFVLGLFLASVLSHPADSGHSLSEGASIEDDHCDLLQVSRQDVARQRRLDDRAATDRKGANDADKSIKGKSNTWAPAKKKIDSDLVQNPFATVTTATPKAAATASTPFAGTTMKPSSAKKAAANSGNRSQKVPAEGLYNEPGNSRLAKNDSASEAKCLAPLVGGWSGGPGVHEILPDKDISVSSHWPYDKSLHGRSRGWSALYSRINRPHSCWLAKVSDDSQWIQWNFETPKEVRAIQTRGRPHRGARRDMQWVSEYTLSYSTDGKSWTKVPGTFEGNKDMHSIVTNTLAKPLLGVVLLKLHPTKWQSHIAMRAEVLGCKEPTATKEVVEWVPVYVPVEVPIPATPFELEPVSVAAPNVSLREIPGMVESAQTLAQTLAQAPAK